MAWASTLLTSCTDLFMPLKWASLYQPCMCGARQALIPCVNGQHHLLDVLIFTFQKRCRGLLKSWGNADSLEYQWLRHQTEDMVDKYIGFVCMKYQCKLIMLKLWYISMAMGCQLLLNYTIVTDAFFFWRGKQTSLYSEKNTYIFCFYTFAHVVQVCVDFCLSLFFSHETDISL